MKKRLVSIVLTLMMLLSLLPATAFAAEDGVLKMHIQTKNGEEAVTNWDTRVYNNWEARFYLDGSTKPIDPEKLTLPGFLRLESVDQDGGCILESVAVGKGVISYDGHDLPVESTLPDMGLYSAATFNEDTVIREVTISEDSKVFYIALRPELVIEGRKMTAVNTTFGGEIDAPSVTEIANVALSADGSYATVTVTNLTAEGRYHFEASMDGGATGAAASGSTTICRSSISLICGETLMPGR